MATDHCRCGSAIAYPFDDLGCLECGQPCCPVCSVVVESVTYCGPCAAVLFEGDGDLARRARGAAPAGVWR